MANTLSLMTNAVRGVVSRQRIRYKENGFDLDLAYVCDNIIAMGYPAENIESIFRNNFDDVYQFFEEKHRNHYYIYNLCSERYYDEKKFHGRVSRYGFDDHNPPPITLIKKFCDDVDAWLKANRNNVAAVHCKAGKGRTGTMICCYLVHSKLKTTAEDALAFYDEKRTKNRKGVTIPSQRRYVEYYAKLVNSGQPYEELTVQICEINLSSQLFNQDNVYCVIRENRRSDEIKDPKTKKKITLNLGKTQANDLRMNNYCCILAGDVKMEIGRKVMKKKEKYFHFWFNTYFLCDTAAYVDGDGSESKFIYELSKFELDVAHNHKTVPDDFKIQLVFKLVPQHEIVSDENLDNNHHVIPDQLQNHNNQVPNCLHNSINSQAASIGQTIQVSPGTDRTLLSSTIGLNYQNQQAQHTNQKQEQNSDSNPTKRKHHQNNQNHYSNYCLSLGSVVLRQSDEEIPVKQQQPLKVVNNDAASAAATTAGAAIHTPSVSSDISRTNSSSRSSSINSEVSSNASEEDWESEFQHMECKGKRHTNPLRKNYSDNIVMMTTSIQKISSPSSSTSLLNHKDDEHNHNNDGNHKIDCNHDEILQQ